MQSILHHRSNDQPRPGPIGLAIRVVLGSTAIQGLISLLTRLAQLPGTAPNPGGLLAHRPDHLCALPNVFDIALGRRPMTPASSRMG
jgi:hypothetical protein